MRYLTASTIMKLISPLVSVVPLMSSVLMGVEVVLIAEQALEDVGGWGLLDPLGGDVDAGDGGAEQGHY